MKKTKKVNNKLNIGIFRRVNILTGLSFSIRYIQIAGYWKPNSFKGWKTIVYYIYTFIISLAGLGVLLAVQCIDLCLVWGDIPLMASNIIIFFSNVVQFLKIFNLIWNQNKIHALYDKCKNYTKETKNHGKNIIINRYAVKSIKEIIYYLSAILLTVAMWTASPVLNPQPGDKKDFPLRVWHSLGMTPPFIRLAYLHQLTSVIYLTSLNVAKDTLLTGLVNHAECQLALLKYSLAHLTDGIGRPHKQKRIQKKLVKRKQREEKRKNNMIEIINSRPTNKMIATGRRDCTVDLLPDDIAYTRLMKCVNHHQEVMKMVDEIEESFYLMVLSQFTLLLLILCFTTYQLAVMININLMRVAAMCLYLSTMMFQLYIYCWHGNEIAILSTDVIGAAYECKWYLTSKKFRNALTILMARSTKPARLSAGGLITISVETFVSIVKASYSFFTVLKHFKDPLRITRD